MIKIVAIIAVLNLVSSCGVFEKPRFEMPSGAKCARMYEDARTGKLTFYRCDDRKVYLDPATWKLIE